MQGGGAAQSPAWLWRPLGVSLRQATRPVRAPLPRTGPLPGSPYLRVWCTAAFCKGFWKPSLHAFFSTLLAAKKSPRSWRTWRARGGKDCRPPQGPRLPEGRGTEEHLRDEHAALALHEALPQGACALPGPLQAAHGLGVLPSAPVDGAQVVAGAEQVLVQVVLPVGGDRCSECWGTPALCQRDGQPCPPLPNTWQTCRASSANGSLTGAGVKSGLATRHPAPSSRSRTLSLSWGPAGRLTQQERCSS